MYLLIDVGNTRIKWILVENSYGAAVVQYGSIEKLAKALVTIDRAETKVLLSAVNQIDNLLQILHANGFNKIVVAKSQAREAGIVNSYAQPERMGVDRWLAMIACYQLQSLADDRRGLIIVDAGSALTIDVLNQEGVHQGGYIVPGLKMAESVLFSNTEQVTRYDEPVLSGSRYGALNKLGNNTVQCVEYGVINQHIALIEQVARQYPEYKIMITGGDGDLLASFTPAATVDENLVLKGLWQVRN